MSRKIPDAPPLAPEGIPPRRVVLRGALAASCGLLLPALWGCKQETPSTAGTPPEPPAGPAPAPESAAPAVPEQAAPEPAAPAKVSQASVQYQLQPKGDQKCADCLHFVAESNTCNLVEGNISPNGWCVLWAQKA